MQFKEQQKLLDALKPYEKQFTEKERAAYNMFLKRQKDDEDFDTLSMKNLKELHTKYVRKKDISELNKYFKK